MLAAYYRLTKPGIVYGNVMTTAAGFLFASKQHIDGRRLLATLLGTALVIGGACVINNFIDRRIDAHMARTKQRALVRNQIRPSHALLFGTLLGVIGFAILGSYTNLLTVGVGVVGVFAYLVMYSVGKRQSAYGTLIGSIAGATPIVAGYTAVSNSLDGAATLLFAVMAVWQMPHFYAISLFRLEDYRSAGLPVWPITRGVMATKRHIVCYIGAFMVATSLLTIFGYTGYTFLIVMTLLGVVWLRIAWRGVHQTNTQQWARTMFGFSLKVLLALSILLSLQVVLP